MPDTDPYAAIAKPITPPSTPPSGDDPYAAIAKPTARTTPPPTSGNGTVAPVLPMRTIAAQEPANGMAQKFARWAGNVMNDLEYGTDHTGVGTVLKKMGAHGVSMGNPEEVGQFMASIPLGLLRYSKGMAEVTDPEHGAVAWQGLKDAIGGASQAATIPTSFVAPEAGELATDAGEMTANAAKAAVRKAHAAGRAARDLYTGEAAHQAVQEDLAQGIRGIIKGAAGDRNIQLPDNIPSIRDISAHLADALRTPPPAAPDEAQAAATAQNELQKGLRNIIRSAGQDARPLRDAEGNWIPNIDEPESIRDVAQNLSDALHTKASRIYQQLDDTLGGTRFQSFANKIRDLNETLRNTSDPEAESKLLQQLTDEHAKMSAAIDTLKSQGVDPSLIKEASATFKQHKAVEELSNHVRKTTRGLRPELRQAGQEATPELLNAGQLETRINGMYDSGTLQDALGEGRAQDLLRHIDRAQVATPKAPAALRGQSDALDEVTQAIRDAAEGSHPEDREPGKPFTPETLDIEKLFNNLHDLRDDGRLQEALGPGRARDLLQEVDTAKIRALNVARRVNRAKTGARTALKWGALGAGAAGVARTGEHLLEGIYSNR